MDHGSDHGLDHGSDHGSWIGSCLACRAGVLLVRANAKSSRSFVRPAIFDLQLEWTVGVKGGGGEKRRLPEEAVKMP